MVMRALSQKKREEKPRRSASKSGENSRKSQNRTERISPNPRKNFENGNGEKAVFHRDLRLNCCEYLHRRNQGSWGIANGSGNVAKKN